MKKLTSLLLALVMLFTALTLSGCWFDDNWSEGYYYPLDYEYSSTPLGYGYVPNASMYAISDKNSFSINDISFSIVYGIHAIEYFGDRDRRTFDIEDYLYYELREHHPEEYGKMYFAIYICEDYCTDFPIENDYENVENHQFIKALTEEEAFSEEYGYVVKIQPIFSMLQAFNHIEKITIPAEYIKNNHGEFMIKFVCLCESKTTGQYYALQDSKLSFYYEKINENTVRIVF